ncbi:MAG: succinate dehydrogenase, partial [Gemmatimonadaceae bacterium]|nr:succinate dehydrogenase [Gemmatimonadaceae bacterium]
NVVLLSGYTLGCHSLRHLVGGYLDRMAGRPVRRTTYACVSCLNRGHMNWAWASLFWVAFTDVYVRLCAMGIWHDWRLV